MVICYYEILDSGVGGIIELFDRCGNCVLLPTKLMIQ